MNARVAAQSNGALHRLQLGVFGGTFDPIHLAHLRLAEEAREYCSLDQVLFLPTADPPHKTLPTNSPSFSHRLAMVEAAIAGNAAFKSSPLEGEGVGKNYTVNLLQRLHTLYPGSDLYFIIGMDSYRDLAQWHDYRTLFTLTNLVVTRRPGVETEDLQELLPVAVRSEFCYDLPAKMLIHRSGQRVILLEETYLDISSTYIRQLLFSGRSIRYLLPAAVADYIDKHALYRGHERQ